MLPLLAGLGVKWFDPCCSVVDAPVQGWVIPLFGGQPPSSCCLQDIPRQETWSEAQSKFEAPPVISWLFLPGPAGASEASRDVAGAELLVWPVGLEKLTRRKTFLALDSPNLVGIVGFVAPLWLIADLPLQPFSPQLSL